MVERSNDQSLVEHVECCPFCKSAEKKTIKTKNLLRIVKCGQCGLLYTDCRWNDKGIALYYQDGYFTGQVPGAYKDYNAELDEKLIDFNYKYKTLKRFIDNGSLLDIGCATGVSLISANELDFKPEGLEFSQWAVEQNTTDFPIFNQDLLSLNEIHQYDAVSMWDVIEHFIDPNTAFKKLNEIIKPGGMLAFTYPDASSFMAKLLGKYWMVLIPEEHYFFYPSRLLEEWLGRFGFAKVKEYYENRYFSFGKLCQKVAPPLEKMIKPIGLSRISAFISIPYKRLAIYKKIKDYG